MDYKLPTEIVDLPSKGLLYNKNTSLHTGKVELRYLTAKDEDILTSTKLIQSGEVFKVLLKNIIVDPDIKYDEILITDRDSLLIMARIMAYGSDYKFSQTCPRCGEVNNKSVDLTKLDFEEFDEELLKDSNNEFEFTLPKSGLKITFKLLNVKDQYEIQEEVSSMDKLYKKNNNNTKSKINHTASVSLAHSITSIDGNKTYKYIYDFVRNSMILSDIKELRKYIQKISPGVDTSYMFDCDECGYEDKMEIKIDSNFFWPKT